MSARTDATVHRAAWVDLDPVTAYGLMRLRVDVFVVEQECAYPELDGRDLEPTAEHLWTADADGPSAVIRLLRDPEALRIGRVATRADARGQGLAGDLIRAALLTADGAPVEEPVVLDAQSHLSGWYARFGFAVEGEEFLEDGIPHLPMRRERVGGRVDA